ALATEEWGEGRGVPHRGDCRASELQFPATGLIPEPVTHDVFPCNKHEPVLPNSPDTPRNIALT
ncbi:Gag polyprotein, partial [Dissostichus eleginoides]